MLSTVPGANMKAAAARIDALLEDQPLTVAGYTWMTMHREEPIAAHGTSMRAIRRFAGSGAAGAIGWR